MAERNSKAARLLSLEAALKEHLKCISCKEMMWPPIRHCERGHSFCENCYKDCKSDGCIKCGEESHGDRTHHLEKMFDVISFSCRYEDIGCQIRLPYNDLRKHESMCVAFWSFCLDPWIKSPDKR